MTGGFAGDGGMGRAIIGGAGRRMGGGGATTRVCTTVGRLTITGAGS
jgi:hypothetical protein